MEVSSQTRPVTIGSPATRKLIASSPFTLAAVLLAESAWIYSVLGFAAAVVGLSVVFTPASVLIPFAAGAVFTVIVARFRGAAAPTAMRRRPDDSRSPTGGGWRARLLASLLGTVVSAAAAAAYTALGVASVLATVWWELYRGSALFQGSWISSMWEDARLSSDFVAPFAWLVIAGVALWVRGTALARGDRGLPPLLVRSVVGTSVLLALALVGPAPRLAAPAALVFAAYLLAAAAAMSFSRLDAATADGGASPAWRWGSTLVSAFLLVAGLAAAVALAWWGAQPVRALWDAAFAALYPPVVAFFTWLAHLFGHDQPPAQLPPPSSINPGDPERSLFTLPEQIREVARWMFNLGWMGTITYAIYATVDRWLTGDRVESEQGGARERRGLGWWGSIRRFVAGVLLTLSRWYPPLARLLARGNLDRPAGTVREIYRRLLRWSAGEGLPIALGTTPREHRAAMAAAWPELAEEFNTLTEGYLRARFSGAQVEECDLEATVAGWLRIQDVSRRGRRSHPGGAGGL